MSQQFEQIKINKPGKNVFDRSHEVNLSCNMGKLIPFLCEEILPGDKYIVNSEILVRFQPMLAPIMHRIDVYTHFFFVPNRIIWSDWEEFITGGEDGLDAKSVPTIPISNALKAYWDEYMLGDYLGIPPVPQVPTVSATKNINSLPFRAYQQIWNDYYRDQNIEQEIIVDDDPAIADLVEIRNRAWEKDYFTSALPWAQRGGEVEISLGLSAPLDYVTGGYNQLRSRTSGTVAANFDQNLQTDASGDIVDISANDLNIDNSDSLQTDLSGAVGSTVNEFRQLVKIQQWLEANARGGSRYIEQILSHFGVRSSDARLQRAEYLGGGRQPVVISEVLSTVEATGAPQGQMTGHGLSVGKSNKFTKSFEEHGYVFGIISVMPKPSYQQGIHKMFTRSDNLDFYWPEFAQLGEQEIEDHELYIDYADVGTNNTFGYQSRYAEYKYADNRVCGDMRSTLEFWHMGRIFASKPSLNESFIQCNPTHRVFAVTDEDEHKLIIQIWNQIKAIRPIPYFNIPTI